MLDDLSTIAQKDPQGMLKALAESSAQLWHEFDIATDKLPSRDQIDHVVLLGMGGSALAGEFLKVWPGLEVPFIISRNYDVPPFVNDRSLVIACSYSGNTEETLEAMDKAEKRQAQLVVVAHGGKLKERATARQLPFAELPECVQPRAAAFYGLRALAAILEQAGFFTGALTELEAVGRKLVDVPKTWTPDVPITQNAAKQLAEEIAGKTPIIYGGVLFGAAYKWKISFNENAKNLAWCNALPEFNHNEFIGWSSHPIEKPFVVVNLISSFDHPRVRERFTVSEKMLSGMRPESIDIQAKGESLLEQIIWVVMFGDFVSTYVALLNGVNPSPVDLVEKFKKELN
jgi:glucose/mannose-6-phosphate isomerase